MLNKILVVCIGNICRSPMGEALFKHRFQTAKLPVTVSSAGISALVGHEADPFVLQILKEQGIDGAAHRARQLTSEMLMDAELVLVMEERHRREIERLYPNACGRVHLLGKWTHFEVPDPYRQPIEIFQDTFALVNQGVDEWITKLWK